MRERRKGMIMNRPCNLSSLSECSAERERERTKEERGGKKCQYSHFILIISIYLNAYFHVYL